MKYMAFSSLEQRDKPHRENMKMENPLVLTPQLAEWVRKRVYYAFATSTSTDAGSIPRARAYLCLVSSCMGQVQVFSQ